MNPKLRSVSFQTIIHQNQRMWLLDDGLKLTDQQFILPYPLALMASRMDGSQNVTQLHKLLQREIDPAIPLEIVTDAVRQFDDALLLDNNRSRRQIQQLKEAWQTQRFRPMAFAGLSYPEDSAELNPFLNNYSADDTKLAAWPDWHGRALISPHIDFQRGGTVYGKVWQRAKAAIQEADLVLIFGTDHRGGPASITLSSIPYATPYGILPTDTDIVNQLVDTLGEKNAYDLELNHMQEHAIEFATTWLHHVRRECCPVIPILIGSFHHFTPNGHPSDDTRLVAFMDMLKALTAGKKVFSIASVDLAHVGPAFDSDYLMDDQRKQQLAQTDAALMQSIENGDKEAFYQQLASTRNVNNVCGFSPTYLMLDYLGKTKGQIIDYGQCSADADNTSIVSICGMLLD